MTAGRSVPVTPDAAAARKLRGPARAQISLAPVLTALSDPVRLAIVCKLANGCELSCSSFHVPIAKSTLTHHLRVLREAGVITQRQVGTSKLTCLRRDDLDARFPGLLDSVLTAAEMRRTRAGRTRSLRA
jgi:DNA-binding transcriptional ArsR family regulator